MSLLLNASTFKGSFLIRRYHLRFSPRDSVIPLARIWPTSTRTDKYPSWPAAMPSQDDQLRDCRMSWPELFWPSRFWTYSARPSEITGTSPVMTQWSDTIGMPHRNSGHFSLNGESIAINITRKFRVFASKQRDDENCPNALSNSFVEKFVGGSSRPNIFTNSTLLSRGSSEIAKTFISKSLNSGLLGLNPLL
jgi:hypothetical protein